MMVSIPSAGVVDSRGGGMCGYRGGQEISAVSHQVFCEAKTALKHSLFKN